MSDYYELGKKNYARRASAMKFFTKNWVNSSGHSHAIPGIWDSDNGLKAGLACFSCMILNIELGNFKPNAGLDLRQLYEPATIEDLKQNPHVQGLLECLKFYGTQDVMARTWNKDGTTEIDFGTRARAKLKEWK